jgi:hypothetical protein
MRRTERVVDIENLLLAELHSRAELIKESRSEPRRLGLARCILQTADGRLRGQRCPALRAAPDRDLHQRIMPQPVEVDGAIRIAQGLGMPLKIAAKVDPFDEGYFREVVEPLFAPPGVNIPRQSRGL